MVRIPTKKDVEVIKDLYKQESKNIGSFNLFYSWDNFLLGKNSYFLMYENSAFVRYSYSKKMKCYVVNEIAVLQNYKGKGIGTKLIEGVPKPILLKCNCSNINANRFYEKIGFVKQGVCYTKKGVKQNIWLCAE